VQDVWSQVMAMGKDKDADRELATAMGAAAMATALG
jgi:hypothetical protein